MESEAPVIIDCHGDRLLGILHMPTDSPGLGIVIVVGGPQYRAGSHRQFVLMARMFASAGFPVLRFDYRGMGDSEGGVRTFEDVGDDIDAAIAAFRRHVPGLRKVVLLGLCDAASAILMYVHKEPRMGGLVLMNPWVRTVQGEAKAYVRHYYMQRLLQRSFWRKVFSGGFDIRKSAREFSGALKKMFERGGSGNDSVRPQDHFVTRMLYGLHNFTGPVQLILSGRDLTASEFVDKCNADRSWSSAMTQLNTTTIEMPDADHTHSTRAQLDMACGFIVEWLRGEPYTP